MLSLEGLPSPVKLRDDLKIAEEQFDINSYLEKSEAFKYVGELPGVEDIIKEIEGFIGEIFGFVEMILDILTKLLEWLDVFGLIGSLEDLMQFMFSLFNNNLFGFGFSLDTRSDIMNAFKQGCIQLDNTYKYNGLEQYALMSLLIGLGCSGIDNAYSTTYDLFMNNKDIQDKKTELSYIYKEYNTIDNPDEKTTLLAKITSLENEIAGKENAINALFMSATPVIFNVMSKDTNASPDKVISFTTDVNNTPIAGLLGENTSGISNMVLNALSKTSNVEETTTSYKYPYMQKVYDETNYSVESLYSDNGVRSNVFESFITSLSTMDSSFNNQKIKENPVLSSMAERYLMTTPILNTSIPAFNDMDYLLF